MNSNTLLIACLSAFIGAGWFLRNLAKYAQQIAAQEFADRALRSSRGAASRR